MSQRKPAASSRNLRRIVIAVLVLALAVTGIWYARHRAAADTGSAYRTASIERGAIRVAISATGTLSAISTVTVGSQISGLVNEVLVDYNDKVSKGQVIARIDPSTYEAQIVQGSAAIASAEAVLRQSQATLRNAEADYARKSSLARRQLISGSDLDLSRSARDQARAQVNAAQAQVRQQGASTQSTRLNLQRTVIRSPVDGVVLTRSIEPGQTVAASFSAPELFKIAEDLGKMQILLAVDESDIGQVRAGQGVSFTADAFPDRQFRGKVEQVRLSATTTNNVVTYPVVVTVDNSDGTLLPGLTVNAEIEVSKRDDVLKVSNAALRYKPADDAATPAAAPAGAPRGNAGGIADDLAQAAATLKLDAPQQAAFDAALATVRQRQAARQAAPAAAGNPLFGGGRGGPGGGGRIVTGGGGDLQAQMRQRMVERFRGDFAAFRGTLDDPRRAQWDAAVSALVGAKRVALYKLVDGKPQMTMVRIGASDGSSSEVSGDIKAGDAIVTGERAAQ